MISIKVWSRFSRTKSDGSVMKFRIQDLPKDRYEDALDFIKVHFMPEETLQRAAGIGKSEYALAEGTELFRGRLTNPTVFPVMCCLDKESDLEPQILGVSIVEITERNDTDHSIYKELMKIVETQESVKVLEILEDIHASYSVLKKYGFDSYYDGRGISVHLDYRGLGIATEFVKQRRQMCVETGVPMTVAWMTALGTQKAAQKEGWETVAEVSFEDIGKRHGVVFENAPVFNKLMICRV